MKWGRSLIGTCLSELCLKISERSPVGAGGGGESFFFFLYMNIDSLRNTPSRYFLSLPIMIGLSRTILTGNRVWKVTLEMLNPDSWM
jgi:hypothetical protein